jgi:hypothetical protein
MSVAKSSVVRVVVFCYLFVVATGASAAPCDGVDRSLSSTMRAQLAPVIEAHLKAQLDPRISPLVHVQAVDVLRVFRTNDWYIVYVNTNVTDESFVFYDKNPVHASAYLTVWAGAAAVDERKEIEKFALESAPGIPKRLAGCFAWYVTQGRTK